MYDDLISGIEKEIDKAIKAVNVEVSTEEEEPQEKELENWEIVLFSKGERGFDSLGVLADFICSVEEAYDLFGTLVNGCPPHAVLQDSSKRIKANEDARFEYEIRLVRRKYKRIVAVVQWNDDVIRDYAKDFIENPMKHYQVIMNVAIPPSMSENPEDWDWGFLYETGMIEITTVELTEQPSDML